MSRQKKLSVKSIFTVRKFKKYLLYDVEVFKILFVACFTLLGGFLYAGREYTRRKHTKTEIDLAENQLVHNIEFLIDEYPEDNFIKEAVHRRTLYYIENYELLDDKEFDVVWTLPISVYYVFVMITTVGYGDFLPATDHGKLLTIFYTGIGIAMCLSIFIKFGNVIVLSTYNTGLLLRYFLIKLIRKRPAPVPMRAKELKDVGLIFVLMLNVFYISLGAGVLYYNNELGFLDCFYFLVITMSTIGFGDIYPDQNTMYFCIALTCIGLGLMASLFTKIRRWVQHNIEIKLIKCLSLKRRRYRSKEPRVRIFSRLQSTLEVPDSIFRRFSEGTESSFKTTKGGSVLSWSDYGEQAYVVDFERCIVM